MKKRTLNTLMATALTASLVLPVSTANASVHSASTVSAGQVANVQSGTMSLTITSVSTNTIYTSNGQFTINNALKPIFSSDNRSALMNAQATVNVENGRIVGISSLTLSKKGTAKKSVTFDGGEATISGNLTIAGDYIKVQNVMVKRDLMVSSRVKKGLALNNVSVGDSIKFQPLRMKKQNWLNVSITNMPKAEINVQRNKVALISEKPLSRLYVTDDIPQLKVEADVEKLVIDVKKDFSLLGTGIIDSVTVKGGKKVDLESDHQFKHVQIDDKKANVLVTIVDKAALNTLVAASTFVAVSANGFDVASTDKWTTQAEKSAFESALNTAKAIVNDKRASQEQVNATQAQLNTALTTYRAAQKIGKRHVTGDKYAITALINSITYVETSWNGANLSYNTAWTTQVERSAIESAVSAARSVANSYNPTQDQIITALNNLEMAISNYKSAQKYGLSGNAYYGDLSSLVTLIDTAKGYYVNVRSYGEAIPSDVKWTTQSELDTFVSAITSAESIVYYSTTQYDVSNAIYYLNEAINTYQRAYKYGTYPY